MQFNKTTEVPNWDYLTIQNAVVYWEKRGFKVEHQTEDVYHLKRGNIIHNAYTFNMKKLETRLTLHFEDETYIHANLDVNTAFQMIVSSESMFWDLEMQEFESVVLHNKFIPELWKKQRSKYTKQITAIIIGIIVVGVLLGLLIVGKLGG
jgi:hypothetical protein